jgi:hypothetical protein
VIGYAETTSPGHARLCAFRNSTLAYRFGDDVVVNEPCYSRQRLPGAVIVAVLLISSCGGDGTKTVPIASHASHFVELHWTASPSAASGYNVYRGTHSGGPYTRMNSSFDLATAYTDNTVQAGQTYYYVTTAVDSSGIESVFSNETMAVISTP